MPLRKRVLHPIMAESRMFSPAPALPAAPVANAEPEGVSGLSRRIKQQLEDGIGYVRVRGEISSLSSPGSGHLYLSLRENNDKLDAVCWRNRRDALRIKPEMGMRVVAEGTLTSYGPNSRYQLNINQLSLDGVGSILQQLEELKQRLLREGLFDPTRKKSLPKYPRHVGVITSAKGAVFQDICNRLRARWPCQITLVDSSVQGPQAVQQLLRGLAFFARTPNPPDVVIIGRGGGSLEDLWCFNDEQLVRAVAAFPLPIVSAVGHETDNTLIDLAADLRAPTPTAAAEIISPVRDEIQLAIARCAKELTRHMESRLNEAQQRKDFAATRAARAPFLERAQNRLARLTLPTQQHYLQTLKLRTHEFDQRLKTIHATMAQQRALLATRAQQCVRIESLLANAKGRLDKQGVLLDALSYKRALDRGFALVRHRPSQGEEQVMNSLQAARAATGDASSLEIAIEFADGVAPATLYPRRD